jgi:hypothetical protein
MNMEQFLQRLQGSGEVLVARDEPVERGEAERVLREWEAVVRADGSDGLPEYDPQAALWAAERLYAACALFAHRDLGGDEVAARLAVPCPSSSAIPSTHYSVDLVMRQLPQLIALARRLAPGDSLLAELWRLAREWPLSSVGLPPSGPMDLAPILGHQGLARHYVDRVLQCGDRARAGEPAVREWIETGLGLQIGFAGSLWEQEIAGHE